MSAPMNGARVHELAVLARLDRSTIITKGGALTLPALTVDGVAWLAAADDAPVRTTRALVDVGALVERGLAHRRPIEGGRCVWTVTEAGRALVRQA